MYTTTANRHLFHNALLLCQHSSKQTPISQHVTVMPTFFQTDTYLTARHCHANILPDTYLTARHCHANILPNRHLSHSTSLSCQHSSKQTPISQHVTVMPTFFQTDAYFTARCCHANLLPNSPGIEHATTANRQMPFSLYVTVMPTFFQMLEALNTPQPQPDK